MLPIKRVQVIVLGFRHRFWSSKVEYLCIWILFPTTPSPTPSSSFRDEMKKKLYRHKQKLIFQSSSSAVNTQIVFPPFLLLSASLKPSSTGLLVVNLPIEILHFPASFSFFPWIILNTYVQINWINA